MPNWCSNSITIHNPRVFKEKCIKPVIQRDDNDDIVVKDDFSFENIIPQPEHMNAYNNITMDYDVKKLLEEEQIDLEKFKEADKIPNELFTRNAMDYLHAKPWMDAEAERTGVPADAWYEWDCANWGTKWDVSDNSIDMDDLNAACNSNEDYSFVFDTAWAPPIPVLEKMAELGVEFDWDCEEPGMEIFMAGEAVGGLFSYGNTEPPKYDEDGNRIEDDE